MSFLSHLEWRYATKKFDPTKKISPENLSKILEAIRMTPTSFGLQAYHFYVVSNPELLAKIQLAAYNQPQITTASHLIVMCARTDLMKAKEEYFDAMSGGDSIVRASLSGFEQMISGYIPNSSPEWAKKQVYIAQGFMLAACAELEIDSCPMEGFDPVAVTDILSIPQDLSVAVIIPIGYRSSDEILRPKVRFSQEKLFTFIE